MKKLPVDKLKIHRKINPFHKFIDGSSVPFGSMKDGVYHLNYESVMDGDEGGYMMHPIYGVADYTYIENFYAFVACNTLDEKKSLIEELNNSKASINEFYAGLEPIRNNLNIVSYDLVVCYYVSIRYKENKRQDAINDAKQESIELLKKVGINPDKSLYIDFDYLMPFDGASKKYTDHRYLIFIGEPPHKNGNGEWITYNEVPKFSIGAFGGAHYIDKDILKPHFIRMIVEEFDQEQRKKARELEKEHCNVLREARDESYSKAFKMIWHVSKWWMKHYLPHFSHYKGEHATAINFYPKWLFFNKVYSIQFVYEHNKSESHIVMEQGENLYWLFIKEHNKWSWRTNKSHNDGCCCSL